VVDPARDLVVIVLTQRTFDGPVLPAAHRDIRQAAFAALG
jgi:CubicO group peptidase (beta-lactamase class C family)